MIVSILFAIVFTVLLFKAIFETIWGVCLIIFGIACHILAAVLKLLAMTIRFSKKLLKKPEPRRLTIGECFMLVNCPNSPQAKRIRTSFSLNR